MCGFNRPDANNGINRPTGCGKSIRRRSPRSRIVSGARSRWSSGNRRIPQQPVASGDFRRSHDSRGLPGTQDDQRDHDRQGDHRHPWCGPGHEESKDVSHAEDNVAALQQQLSDLESQFNAETSALAAATDPLTETLDRIMLKPSKSNIAVKLVALVWVPHWRMTDGTSLPAWS